MDIRWLTIIPLPVLFWLLIELIRDEALPVPLPRNTIRRMLKMAELKENEIVYDLGSGDGRTLVIAAREFKAKAVGIEKNRFLIWLSRRAVKGNKLQRRVKIIHGDIFKETFDDADVIFMYLSHKLTQKLRPIFEAELKEGTRIVSASHKINGWKEVKKIRTGHFYSYLYKL